MDELEKKIEKTRKRNLARAKANYRLAKKLGFTASEACVLAHRSAKNIRELAKSKKKPKNG